VEADPTGATMGIDWNERLRRQAENERLLKAIKTGDYGTALMALFVEVRRVEICKHGNITDYQPCPQCESYLDEMLSASELEDE
jgi:hypothetical protein